MRNGTIEQIQVLNCPAASKFLRNLAGAGFCQPNGECPQARLEPGCPCHRRGWHGNREQWEAVFAAPVVPEKTCDSKGENSRCISTGSTQLWPALEIKPLPFLFTEMMLWIFRWIFKRIVLFLDIMRINSHFKIKKKKMFYKKMHCKSLWMRIICLYAFIHLLAQCYSRPRLLDITQIQIISASDMWTVWIV